MPWCRKSAVMVAIDSVEGHDTTGVFLWGGKGEDKADDLKGQQLLADIWTAAIATDTNDGTATFGGWEKVPQKISTSPDPRWKSSGDRMGSYFVAFGGDDFTTFLNDLWVLPLASINDTLREGIFSKGKSATADDDGDDDPVAAAVLWTKIELAPTAALPRERRGHTLVGMPNSQAMLLVGGKKKHSECLPDAWVLPMPSGWPQLAGVDGSAGGLGWGETAWHQATPIPSSCRWGHSAVLTEDPTTKAEIVAVFGGRLKDLKTGKYTYNNELWFFSLGGGAPGLEGSWSLAETSGAPLPQPRDHTSLSFDSSSSSLFVFGGRCAEAMVVPALNDLWRYSLLAQQWQALPQSSVRRPETRYLHSATFVAAASLASSSSSSAATALNAAPAAAPSAPTAAVSAVAPLGSMGGAGGQLVIFGGEHINKQTGKIGYNHKLNDVWAYSTVTSEWEELVPNDCTAQADPNSTPAASLGQFLFGVIVCAAAVALVLMFASHKAGPGGGDRVCDYWRPRLRTHVPLPTTAPVAKKPRVGGGAASEGGSGGGESGVKAVELMSIKNGANRTRGYESIAESESGA